MQITIFPRAVSVKQLAKRHSKLPIGQMAFFYFTKALAIGQCPSVTLNPYTHASCPRCITTSDTLSTKVQLSYMSICRHRGRGKGTAHPLQILSSITSILITCITAISPPPPSSNAFYTYLLAHHVRHPCTSCKVLSVNKDRE